MAFADKLKSIRESQSFEIQEVANYLGVRRETVWHWEKGKSKPRPRQVRALAKLFKTSVKKLTD